MINNNLLEFKMERNTETKDNKINAAFQGQLVF